MNSRELEEKLKELNVEDFIWIVYIGIIFLSWFANSLERRYFVNNDLESKKKYQSIMILIFAILIIVYLYFLKGSIDDLRSLKETDSTKKKNLVTLSFIASFLIFISGLIFLYIAFVDDSLDVELAFN